MEKNVLGKRVRELRKKMNLSQEELGHILGYSGKHAISKIETGVNGVPSDKQTAFAEALHTTTSYLNGETDVSEDVWNKEFHITPIVLTHDEEELISKYRLISDEVQQQVTELIDRDYFRLYEDHE